MINVRTLGRTDYLTVYAAMQQFTQHRTTETDVNDEIWMCEHDSVFTLGLAGKAEHLIAPTNIPVVATDRGGQVTYHGPGQVVAYPLIDLRATGYFVKEYVFRLEESVLRTLSYFGVTGHRVAGAPGIYVRTDDPFSHKPLAQHPRQTTPDQKTLPNFDGVAKIAALGIKVTRGFTYHGVALNVSMDLTPYTLINPCGYQQLVTTDLSTLGICVSWDEVATIFAQKLSTFISP